LSTPESYNENDVKAIKRVYELALQSRNFEIEQLAQRNNFFMIFQGVLLAGFLQSNTGDNLAINLCQPFLMLAMSAMGFFTSIFQVGMAAGAKFWQERWESALENSEKRLLNHYDNDPNRSSVFEVFSSGKSHISDVVRDRISGGSFVSFLVNCRFSPSRMPIYVAISLSIIWALIFLYFMRGGILFNF